MDTVRRGSPPRGRGKVVPAVIVIGALGITPAWAGKSALWPRCGRDAEDHPRVGGEKADTLGEVLMEMGSPPRGRGKGENMNAYAEGIGITPAWAGKRLSILGLSKGGEDHPRVGGEKLVQQLHGLHGQGSPPRGRGKGLLLWPFPLLQGITPAWAGKSLSSSSTVCMDKDHPRVGGEKPHRPCHPVGVLGSPPRGRGKGSHPFLGACNAGITPAWAGKSTGKGQHPERGWDHPRVGGEKMIAHIRANVSLGSPPRGRGKVGHSVTSVISSGITPAWAGKSCGDLDSLHRK